MRGMLLTTMLVFIWTGVCLADSAEKHGLADELKLFEDLPVVITASRRQQPVKQAPATVDVISSIDIKKSGATTLAELLERLPGVYVPTSHNGQDMFIIRGVGGRYNDKTLLLIDGFPFRTLYYYHHPINEQIPLADIKQIEIVRGPGSALYGTNAFAGVINIITKKAGDIQGTEASFSIGSWRTQNHHILFGKKYDQGEVVFMGRYLDIKGYRIEQDEEGDASDKLDYTQNTALNFKASYNDFNFQLRYSKLDIPDVTEPDNVIQKNVSEYSMINLGYCKAFTKKWELQAKLYHNQFNHDKPSVKYKKKGGISFVKDAERYGQITGFDLQSQYDFTKNNSFVSGFVVEREYLDHEWTKEWDPADEPFFYSGWVSKDYDDTPTSITNYMGAVFIEDEIRLKDKWFFNFGLRYDYYEATDSRLSPRGSIVFLPDNKTTMKIHYGEAFRSPSYRELYKQSDDGTNEGNPDLKSEVVKSLEFETSREFSKHFRADIALYHSRYKDFIKTIADGNYENIAPMKVNGFEVAVSGVFQSVDISYKANYSFSDINLRDMSDALAIPEQLGNFSLGFTGFKYCDIYPHLSYVGRRNRPLDYQIEADDDEKRDNLYAYTLLNLNLVFKRIPDPFNASFTVKNLLNRKYYSTGERSYLYDRKMPQRQFILKLGMNF